MKKQGFSLIELMVAIAIIAIISAIAIPMYRNYVIRSRTTDAPAVLSIVKSKQELYRATHFKYSDSLAALPGFNSDTENYGEFYQVTIESADMNTFKATAKDLTKAVGSKPKGTDSWYITESTKEAVQETKGY